MRTPYYLLTLAVLAGALVLSGCTGQGASPQEGAAGVEPVEPAPGDCSLDTVIEALNAMGNQSLTWDAAATAVAAKAAGCDVVMNDMRPTVQEWLDLKQLGDHEAVAAELLSGGNAQGDAIADLLAFVDAGKPAVSEPEAPAEPVADEKSAIIDALEAQGSKELTWDGVVEVVEAECVDCTETLQDLKLTFEDELAAETLPAEHEGTAKTLSEGGAAPANDTSALLGYVGDEEPVGAEPPAEGGEEAAGVKSLDEAIAALGSDTTSVRFEYALDKCGQNTGCADEYADVLAAFQAACPSKADCTKDELAILLYGPAPSAQQQQAGICPSTGCVQIHVLKDLIVEVVEPAPAEE